MFRKNLDLVAVSVVAISGILADVIGMRFNSWSAIFGVLLVLVLPGYVFSCLLLPRLPGEERLLVSLGLSLVIDGLSGLLMNLTFGGLNPASWGIVLGMLTVLAVAWLWLRRRKDPAMVQPLVQPFQWTAIAWRPALLYGLGGGLVLLAFTLSWISSTWLESPLTMLWAVSDRTNLQTLKIGVQNEEGKPVTYDLIVVLNNVKVKEWHELALGNGQTFSGQVTFQDIPQRPVEVLLYRTDRLNQVYRLVKVDLTEGPVQTLMK